MTNKLDPKWLHHGHFDLSEDNRRKTRTMQIRDCLVSRMGRRLDISMVPRAPGVYRHTFYWREPDDGATRAQYLAHIDENAPVMYLGLSIEKGMETRNAGAQRMNRNTWDWPRLISLKEAQLSGHVARLHASREQPIYWFVTTYDAAGDVEDSWCYVFDGDWWQRRIGTTSVSELKAKLHEIDDLQERYGDVWIVCALSPADVADFTPEKAAGVLYEFHGLRSELRGEAPNRRLAVRTKSRRKGR